MSLVVGQRLIGCTLKQRVVVSTADGEKRSVFVYKVFIWRRTAACDGSERRSATVVRV